MEGIKFQLAEQYTASSALINGLIRQENKRAQSLVDLHDKLLEDLFRRLPAANARSWAKPCDRVPDWEPFKVTPPPGPVENSQTDLGMKTDEDSQVQRAQLDELVSMQPSRHHLRPQKDLAPAASTAEAPCSDSWKRKLRNRTSGGTHSREIEVIEISSDGE